jgi:hypothetical protein
MAKLQSKKSAFKRGQLPPRIHKQKLFLDLPSPLLGTCTLVERLSSIVLSFPCHHPAGSTSAFTHPLRAASVLVTEADYIICPAPTPRDSPSHPEENPSPPNSTYGLLSHSYPAALLPSLTHTPPCPTVVVQINSSVLHAVCAPASGPLHYC